MTIDENLLETDECRRCQLTFSSSASEGLEMVDTRRFLAAE